MRVPYRLRVVLGAIRRRLPYEVQIRPRQRSEPIVLPKPTLDLIGLVGSYFAETRPGSSVLQVGAADGVAYDALSAILPQGNLQAVLVEPLPDQHRKLEQRYENVPSVRTLNAAVGTSDGEATLYRVSPERWTGEPVAVLWSSFSRRHLHVHGVDDEMIEEVTVPTLTLDSVLQRFDLKTVDLLVSDTEGFDAHVVRMALALRPLPSCICFESVHIHPAEKLALLTDLDRNGYAFAHDEYNTVALHKSLTTSWK